MPPKKPKPQKVDLRELLAAPAPTAKASGPPSSKGPPSSRSIDPYAKPKPKPKSKAKVGGPVVEEDLVVENVDPPVEELVGEELPAPAPVVPEKDLKTRRAEAKAQKEMSKKAEAATMQAAELDREVEMAREEAVRLRFTQGPFNGHIEVGPLTLPNPGGGADLLDDCCFTMAPGRRYGLIGRNGKGKSTLLRYMAARRVGGMPPSVTVHYVSQEVAFGAAMMEQIPADVVIDADVERKVLLAEAASLEGKTGHEDVERLSAVAAHLDAIQAETAGVRAVELLANLGFSEELRSRPLGALSGGWRVRVALAAALFAKPDVLLLDEPTNHLSIQAVMWLSHELANSPTWQSRIVVVVSHDRVFVDEACTDMLHISGVAKRLTPSRGSYSTWAQRRAEQKKARDSQLEKEAAENAKLKEYSGHGFKYGGSSSQINMMKKMEKMLEKNEERMVQEAEEMADLNEDADLALKMMAGGQLDGPAITLQNVAFSYPGAKELFKNVELQIDAQSRIVFVGENGNGKTTLVKLLLDQLKPKVGTVTINRGARIALVNQHHADQLDFTMTPLGFMLSKFPGDHSNTHELMLRSHLADCGIPTLQQSVVATSLSGGQRSRVAMAAVSFEKPHILIMDEPTNNLDLGSIEALADTVNAFDGGVVLVSHDQFFVSRVAREVWNVGNGSVKRLESFESYRSKILAKIQKR